MILLLDVVVLPLSILDAVVLVPLKVSSGFLEYLVVVRILRLWGLLRILRGVKALWPLVVMLESIRASLFSCLLVFKLFAVLLVFVALTAYVLMIADCIGNPDHEDCRTGSSTDAMFFFSSLGKTIITVLTIIWRGAAWGETVRLVLVMNPLCGVWLVAFVMAAHLWLVHVVSAVFIEEALVTERRTMEQFRAEKGHISEIEWKKIKGMLQQQNVESEHLSWDQCWEIFVAQPHFLVRTGVTLQEAESVFYQSDIEGDGMVNIDDFMFGLMKHAGQSKTVDMLFQEYQQQTALRSVKQFGKFVVKDAETIACFSKELEENMKDTGNQCSLMCQALQEKLESRMSQAECAGDGRKLWQGLAPQPAEARAPIAGLRPLLGGDVGSDSARPHAPLWTAWLNVLAEEGQPSIRAQLLSKLAAPLHPVAAKDGGKPSEGRAVLQPLRQQQRRLGRRQLQQQR